MTTYNTGNPVPSGNAKDRFDNTQTLDEVVTGPLTYYKNRIGNNVLSLKGMLDLFNAAQQDRAEKFEVMEAEFDAAQEWRKDSFNQLLINTQFEMPPIPYQEGAPIEVSRPTQLISHEGQLYSVKLPASFPFQLSGIWSVAVASLTLREDASLRQQLSAPTGARLINIGEQSLFDYLSDADALGFTSLNAIIKYAASTGRKVTGRGTYQIDNETINLDGKEVLLDLTQATLVRRSEATLTITKSFWFTAKVGKIIDTLSLPTRAIVFSGGGSNVKFTYREGVSDGTPLYILGIDGVHVYGILKFSAFTQPVSSADQGRPFEIKNSAKVTVHDNTWGNCGTGPKIEAIATGETQDVIVLNMRGRYTYDTSLFLRLVATAGRFRTLIVDNVNLDKCGKAGLKFSGDSATGIALEKAILTNITVTGYALNVSSPGVSSFRDASSTGVFIGEVVTSNVIVDGRSLDGTISTLTGDCHGFSLRYVNVASLNGVICRNTPDNGFNFLSVTKVTGAGNIADNCGRAARLEVNKAGVSMTQVQDGTLQIDSYRNAGDGYFLDKVKGVRLSGVANDNDGHAIKTVQEGIAANQTTGNIYSITGLRNANGFAAYAERVADIQYSQEVGCIDDLGPRNQGSTARRDAMTAQFGPGMFRGLSYWNITTSTRQTYTGAAWV